MLNCFSDFSDENLGRVTLKDVIKVEGISIEKTVIDGNTLIFSPVFTPNNTNQTDVMWECDSELVTCLHNGNKLVVRIPQGVSNHTMHIVGKSAHNFNVLAEVSETVSYDPTSVPIEGISDISSQSGAQINTLQLSVVPIPANSTQAEAVSWSVESGPASINSNGLLTIEDNGDVVVTAVSLIDKSIRFTKTITASYTEVNIVFADTQTKAKLVSRYDTNSDGELSEREAAAVTSMILYGGSGSVFAGVTPPISFDEFVKFTHVTSVGFGSSCQIFSSLIFPRNLETVSGTLKGATALTNISLACKITAIPDSFLYGTGLSGTFIVPENIKKVNGAAFNNCSQLTKIVFTAVEECKPAFSNDTCEVDFAGTLAKVEGQMFRDANLSRLIVRSVIPPVWENPSWNRAGDFNIYVPDASVDAYKAATGWADGASRIKPLSEIE